MLVELKRGDRVVLELYDENLDIDDIQIGDQIFVRERIRQALSAKPHQELKQSPKAKKPIYKKWWFWVLIVLIFFAAIGVGVSSSDNSSSTSTNSKSSTHSSTTTVSKTLMSVEDFCSTLQQNFSSQGLNAKIYVDGTVICTNITTPGIALAANQVKYGNDRTAKQSWREMNSAVKSASIAFEKSARENGLDKKYTTLYTVVDDQHPDLAILSYSNGTCVYDWTKT